MNKQWDESWLTGYLLDELTEEERVQVEEYLEKSEQARQELEEIRLTIEEVGRELNQEVLPALTEKQRAGVIRQVEKGKEGFALPRRFYYAAGTAVAAGLVAVVFLNLPGEDVSPVSPASHVESIQDGNTQAVSDSADGLADLAGPVEIEESQVGDSKPAAAPAREKRQNFAGDESLKSEKRNEPASSHNAKSPAVGQSASQKSTQPALEDGRDQAEQESPVEARFEMLQKAENREAPVTSSDSARPKARAITKSGTNSSAGWLREGSSQPPLGGRSVRSLLSVSSGSVVPAEPPPSTAFDEIDRYADLPPAPGDFNTEAYDRIQDNSFIRVSDDPLSTFSIDVDTASYSNLRRFLRQKQLPPKDAVRIEEMINYFPFDYPAPSGEHPFAVHVETASAPWKPEHRLLRVGLKGKEIDMRNRPAGNFVFLLDVSGSMEPENKLPLLKRAMKLMVENLEENDRVAIVVYAGASGLVLPATSGDNKEAILQALERLQAGGSTNGGAGIQLAYKTASENLIENGINRVILATDGDFNVGITNQGDLTRLIEEKAKEGVFLSVLGFGMGNYKDSNLEKLADRGNGNYAYIDTLAEARKVLVEQAGGTLVTIAKDVKIQIEFNPLKVEGYRLIGYENRVLRHQDFNDDRKDAGDIGAGHTVTALYEIVPAGQEITSAEIDPLKYQIAQRPAEDASSQELLTVKLRYKQPRAETSSLIEVPVLDSDRKFEQASEDFRFAAAVASFGMLLRDSLYKGSSSFESVVETARNSFGKDPFGYRAEFVKLVKTAQALQLLDDIE